MEIGSTYVWKNINRNNKNHAFFLPRNIRSIICGKSGCGKTTLLAHLLLEPNILDYDTLSICGNSLHQPEYRVMEAAFKKNLSKSQIKVLFEEQNEVEKCGGIEKLIQAYNGKCKGNIKSHFYTDVASIPDPSEHDPTRKNILVLDDVMLNSQNKAEAYYTRGRHNSVDVFYITQSYFRLPRQTVRENANFYVFFPQDKKNLIHIFNDHCAGDEDLSFQTFSKFCNDVWSGDKHNFVVIDTSRPTNGGKFRKNLSHYWAPQYDRLINAIEKQ